MEIDSTPLPPSTTTQEHSDRFATKATNYLNSLSERPNNNNNNNSSNSNNNNARASNNPIIMNFDYLNAISSSGRQSSAAASSAASSNPNSLRSLFASNTSTTTGNQPHHGSAMDTQSARFYLGDYDEKAVGGSSSSSSSGKATASAGVSYGFVDDRVVDSNVNMNERFVSALDQLDARVEKFRKDAMGLQENKDYLHTSIDLIKTHDQLAAMKECDRDEINLYIHRVNSRLSTVELNVRTVRDLAQEDALNQINELIDAMITMGDPALSRQRCQNYLNSCCSSSESGRTETSGGGYNVYGLGDSLFSMSCGGSESTYSAERDIGPVDKKFESALLGCTLDDQKKIKKRLQALMGYLNKQIIRMQ